MNSHTGQQRRLAPVLIAIALFILCVFPGQSWIAKQVPAISGLVQISPTLVFLEIPTQLPVTIDLILAPGLFLLIYPLVMLFYPSRPGISSWQQIPQRVRSAFTGFFVLLCCLLSGGLIYYFAQGYLPSRVITGINSMGITADIHIPYPGYETIHLRGSMVLFVCFLIGLAICMRKISKEPKPGLTREQRMTPYERIMKEKRMKAKQIQDTGHIQQEEPKAFNWKPAAITTVTIQTDYNGKTRVCNSQPVVSLKPLAVNYMPIG